MPLPCAEGKLLQTTDSSRPQGWSECRGPGAGFFLNREGAYRIAHDPHRGVLNSQRGRGHRTSAGEGAAASGILDKSFQAVGMVTLESIQPATFQAFHGSAPYDNTLNFQSFELALNDVSDHDVPSSNASEPAEEIAPPLEPAKPARRSSLVVPPLANRSGPDEAHRSPPARPAYTQSSSALRLFRPAEPELKSWHAHLPTDESTGIIGPEPSAASKIESRSRASSWHASDMGRRRSPLREFAQQRKDEATSLSSTSPACSSVRRGREDRPTNEVSETE